MERFRKLFGTQKAPEIKSAFVPNKEILSSPGTYYVVKILESSSGGMRDGWEFTAAGTSNSGKTLQGEFTISTFVVKVDPNSKENSNPRVVIPEDRTKEPIVVLAPNGVIHVNGVPYRTQSQVSITHYASQGIADQMQRGKYVVQWDEKK